MKLFKQRLCAINGCHAYIFALKGVHHGSILLNRLTSNVECDLTDDIVMAHVVRQW